MKQPTSTGLSRTGGRGTNSRGKKKPLSDDNLTPIEEKVVPVLVGVDVANELEQKVIDKLEQMVRDAMDNHSLLFTKEEAEALKSVAARERAWHSIGLLAGMFKSILTYLGFFIAAWVSIKAGLLEWLARELGR